MVSDAHVDADASGHAEWRRQVAASACRWAVQAGERIQAGRERAWTVQHKGQGDWASALDAEIEQWLRGCIAQAFPDHAFLGEESAGANASDLARIEHLWVVDPIDGSVNFLRGYPQYSVSIALLERGEPVVACIVDPCRGEVFSAVKGDGAWCNGQRLRVSATTELSQAVAATVFPKPGSRHMPGYSPQLLAVLNRLAGLRRSGSMALELAYLAAGRVDAFWQWGLGPWDAAAGVLLIREAGGQIHTLDGRHWLQSERTAAAAPGVAAQWLALLADAQTLSAPLSPPTAE
jgi:myo-inositol-1(or 4)-monophosphatase